MSRPSWCSTSQVTRGLRPYQVLCRGRTFSRLGPRCVLRRLLIVSVDLNNPEPRKCTSDFPKSPRADFSSGRSRWKIILVYQDGRIEECLVLVHTGRVRHRMFYGCGPTGTRSKSNLNSWST